MEKVEIVGKTHMKKVKLKDKKRNKKRQRNSAKSVKRRQKRKRKIAKNKSKKRSSLHEEIIVSQVNEMRRPTFDRNAFGSSAPIISENIQNVLEKEEGFNKSAWGPPVDE